MNKSKHQFITDYLSNNLSVIPVTKDKRPKVKWTEYQKRIMTEEEAKSVFSDGDNVAIICGEVSGGVECIDVDCKNDLTGTLMNDLSIKIMNKDESLYDKLVIQETINNGYHLVYRCSKIESSQKLAMRDATEEEKKTGLIDNVLIETRGTASYFLAEPSEGYKVIQGNLTAIPKITHKERATLIAICETFNSKSKPQFTQRVESTSKTREISPLDDYDNRGDGLGVLLNAGWTIIKDNNDKTILRRPGGTSPSSGYYHKTGKYANRFTFFSSACGFKVQKVYKPHAIYTEIEHNGNYTSAARQLARDGFGSDEVKFQAKEKIVKSTQKKDLNPLNYLASEKEMMDYIDKVRNGGFQLGLSTGVDELDDYLRHKRKQLNMILGYSGSGKTSFIWWLSILAAKKHRYKIAIHTNENEPGDCRESLMQFYHSKTIATMTEEEYLESLTFVRDHFRILSNQMEYSYETVMQVAEDLHSKWNFDILIIDPFNSLKLVGGNRYEYDLAALSNFRILSKNLDIAIWVCLHTASKKTRELDADKKNSPPEMWDAAGGVNVSNRADDFVSVWRDEQAQAPEDTFIDIYIRKVKVRKTGGKVTPRAEPVRLRMLPDYVGYVTKHDYNPMTGKYDTTEEEVQEQLKLAEKDDYWDYNPK